MAINETADAIVVGATSEDAPGAAGAGAVYVFKLVGGVWTRDYDGDDDDAEGRIQPTGLDVGDSFGCAVDISGDRIIVGARGDDTEAADAGAAYVYEYDSEGVEWDPSATLYDETYSAPEIGWDVPSPSRAILPSWERSAMTTPGRTTRARRLSSTWRTQPPNASNRTDSMNSAAVLRRKGVRNR